MARLLLVHDEHPRVRLLAWALEQEGYTDARSRPADDWEEAAIDVPEFIIFDCGDPAVCEAAVARATTVAPAARIIVLAEADDMPEKGRLLRLGPPYHVERVLALLPRP